MTNIYTLLLMSVSGTIMYALSIIFGKKTKHYVWQYAMLVTAVIMLLVPIQKIVEIPRFFKVTVPENLNISDIAAAPSAVQASVSAADIITAVWLIGTVIFAARIICKYIKVSIMLRQITEERFTDKIPDVYFNVCKRLSIRRSITLRSSRYLNSPLLFGIFKPTIIIPDKAFSERELEMILTHELIHYKHRDLWIAMAASIAWCIHWFNPAVHFMGKAITEVCEFFCDEAVVKRLNASDKKAYGNLILSVVEKELNSRLAYTTSMASAKNNIQKRLRKIVEFKMPTKASTVAGIMAVFACIVSSVTAFGFETAAEVIPEEIK
ncbi:MAG: M56 family metallopeptidase [Clostridia bacterium]|nr:M56 family metallopeptidase [Clostridia bacterium]